MSKMKDLAIQQANDKKSTKAFIVKSKDLFDKSKNKNLSLSPRKIIKNKKIKKYPVEKINKTEKPEYIIIGSNNFWYASGLTSLNDARSEIKEILKGYNKWFADPETGEIKDELPKKFYIYKGIVIDEIYN